MLNRIQNIELNHTHTLNSSEIDADSIEMADPEFRQKLNDEIKKLKYSLNDSTSPSYSHIKKLHRQGLVGDSEKTLQLPNASSKVLNEVVDQLDNICEELENKERTMIQLEQAYTHTLENSKTNTSLKRPHEKDLENEIFEAYLEYQRNLLKQLDYGTGSNFESNKSDEHKIKVIRNVFGVMEPGRMANVGSDLIEFGISHNIPDAVRIGENLSGLNDEDVSEDLLNRLHRYKLQHADDMREAINTSGPMKSIIQRRKESLMTARDRSGYLPSNIEELRDKYGDKYNKWRLPSIYAVDHKKFGILGEIYGEERLEKFLR